MTGVQTCALPISHGLAAGSQPVLKQGRQVVIGKDLQRRWCGQRFGQPLDPPAVERTGGNGLMHQDARRVQRIQGRLPPGTGKPRSAHTLTEFVGLYTVAAGKTSSRTATTHYSTAMSEPGCVMVRDAEGRWLRFGRPLRVVEARHCGQVLGCLEAVDRAVADGLWAAGFLGYEAAPACDQALQVQPDASGFPLLWFGFHTAPEIVPPPEPPADDDGRACAWEPDRKSVV